MGFPGVGTAVFSPGLSMRPNWNWQLRIQMPVKDNRAQIPQVPGVVRISYGKFDTNKMLREVLAIVLCYQSSGDAFL